MNMTVQMKAQRGADTQFQTKQGGSVVCVNYKKKNYVGNK